MASSNLTGTIFSNHVANDCGSMISLMTLRQLFQTNICLSSNIGIPFSVSFSINGRQKWKKTFSIKMKIPIGIF